MLMTMILSYLQQLVEFFARWRARGEKEYVDKVERENREDLSAGRKRRPPKDNQQGVAAKFQDDLMHGDTHGGYML